VEGEPSQIALMTSWALGIALVFSLLVEAKTVGIRQMIRVDNVALVAIYYLSLAEFLIPQPVFDFQTDAESTRKALTLILLGIVSLALGRHLVSPRKDSTLQLPELSLAELFGLMLLCFFVGHSYMFFSVNFNPATLLTELTDPRFTQNWSRGRIGGWSSLWIELDLLTYLVPPIGGMLLMNRSRLSAIQIPVIVGMIAFELFVGMSVGTRHVFAIHLATLCAAIGLSTKELTTRRIISILVPAAVAMLIVSVAALQYRSIGLRQWVTGLFSAPEQVLVDDSLSPEQRSNLYLMVDNNLRAISELTRFYPSQHEYLGSEVVIHGLVHPIPRALWPGKPTDLSVTVEEVMGIEGATIAATFVGEGYMAHGVPGVIGFGLVLGILTAFWNRVGSTASSLSRLLLYAAGFYWAALSMRSTMWMTVAFLPPFFLFIYLRFLLPVFRGPAETTAQIPSSDKEFSE
ncbi:MAG: hypothetical protein AAF585_07885, partial [Verrucomicrobiota bacterium]